jgi:hypothetical protein
MGEEHAQMYPEDTHPRNMENIHSTDLVEHSPTQALTPVNHPDPTQQAISTPTDLTALLADIPSTIHIQNLAVSVSQHNIVQRGAAVEEL